MANTTLQLKKSGVTGNVPSSLEFGELALNYADGKLYYKAANSSITYIQSGSTTDSFATINANSSLILATSPTDTLSIAAGNNITISACTSTKTITINAQDADVDQFARNTGNSALTLAQDAYNYANTISGGAAIDNVARTLAQSAYDLANTAGANTIVTQGVDATQNSLISIIQGVNLGQNTTIIAVNQFVQSAYNTANGANGLAQSAYNQANTNASNISIINGVDLTQNTRLNSIETVNTNQNNSITQVNQFAQSAYNQANSVYLPSVTRLNTTSSGTSSYLFDQYTGNNPNIFIRAGETLAFNLNVTGHPFLIRESAGGTLYNIGLTHVSTTGVVSTESGAQAKVSGTLYWKVPAALAGSTYVYQCQIHGGMVGNIVIEIPNQANSAINLAQAAYDYANTIVSDTQIDQYARDEANTASNNIVVLQGVNGTQNTRLNSIETINFEQNTAISIIQGVNLSQNAEIIVIKGVDLAQNTRITEVNQYAVSGYETANSAQANTIFTQGVDEKQNTTITAVNQFAGAGFNTANQAFNQANTATGLAQAAFNYANTLTVSSTDQFARDTANSASANTIITQGVDSWQNTQITAVNQFAQSAYNQANTGGGGGGTTVTISNDNTSNNVYYINFTANTSGTANTLFTSNNNLTFNPSTGTIGVKAINLTANTNISANTIDLTDTSQVTIDSFSTSVYRSAFYQVQLSSPSEFHMLNLNIIHNGITVFANTFGDAYSSSSLGSFTGSIVGTTLNVLFTPTNSSVTVAFIRNAIARIGVEAPSGSLGFVGDPVTATFNAGFDLDATTSSFDYGTVG